MIPTAATKRGMLNGRQVSKLYTSVITMEKSPPQDRSNEDYSDWIERISRSASQEWSATCLHDRLQIIISGIGLVVLIVYAVFTGFMYYANQESADAAKRSAVTAARELELSERPWMSIDPQIV